MADNPYYRTRIGCFVWWSWCIIGLLILAVFKISEMFVDFILEKGHEYRKWLQDQNLRYHPRYPNGTFITGRLTESELAAATQATSGEQGKTVPFLPIEIIREIIRHATDIFPAPSSIYHPSPSTSQSFSPPPPHPRFPYSSYAFQEDKDIDRKLHALSIRIKLSVSRVSRAWRDVAVEFLFNSIRIYDPRQIPLILRASEADARRRGEEASKETIARPGSAPWWIRELWIDFEKLKHVHQTNSAGALPSFDLADLLKICPNIVTYRGFGIWENFQLPPLSRHDAVFKQILGLPDEWGDETHDGVDEVHCSEFNAPDTGRRIELSFADGWEIAFPIFSRRSIPTPRTLTLPCICSMEVRSLYLSMTTILKGYPKIQLPNLAYLTLRGADSFKYAATRLVLPSLRSVTLGSSTTRPLAFYEEILLESFLETHGLALEELTVLAKPYSEYLQRFDQLCPILHTFRTHYLDLPGSPVPSVRTVGLYGLEHARNYPESGKSVISSIFKVFPNVTTIQDLSWRSSVIRRRAYTHWTDPEGAKRREFWTQVILAVRRGSQPPQPVESGEQFSFQEVALLDWRGKPVEAVPTKPAGGERAMLGLDDQLLDALVSKARHLI